MHRARDGAEGRAGAVAALVAAVGFAGGAGGASCLSTAGLSGGQASLDGGGEGHPPDDPCGADLGRDVANCGACGHACPGGPNGAAQCVQGACTLACGAGFADCDGVVANGCEARTDVDPLNCARCGHSCGGAACTRGACAPVVIVPASGSASTGIVADGAHVFYAFNSASGTGSASSGITRVDLDGSNPLPLTVNERLAIYAITADAASIYWMAMATDLVSPNGAVFKIAKDGAGGPVLLASSQTPQPTSSIAVDATSAYWTNYGTESPGTGAIVGAVVRCPIVGGCGTAPTVLADNLTRPYGLAIDSNSLYFSVAGATSGGAGAVYACPATGCQVGGPSLLRPANEPLALALDPSSVFFTSRDASDVIVKADRAGGAAVTLASAQSGVRALVRDGADLVWASSATGDILSCAVAGCASGPTVLAADQASPAFIASDGRALYWTSASGAVTRLAR